MDCFFSLIIAKLRRAQKFFFNILFHASYARNGRKASGEDGLEDGFII